MRAMQAAVLLSLIAVGESVPAAAQEPPEKSVPQRPVVITTGQATLRLPPDRAYVVLSTEIVAPKPAEAQQRNAAAMTRVHEKLRAALSQDAVRTLAYSLREEFEFVNNRRVSRGYRAVNSIEVRLDDITRVGEILDLAVAAGGTTVSDIRFDLKERDAAERRALRQAVADARARADAAAAGAGAAVVAVLRIDEQSRPGPLPRPVPMVAMRMEADAPETPVTPGEIEIQASVTLTASIK